MDRMLDLPKKVNLSDTKIEHLLWNNSYNIYRVRGLFGPRIFYIFECDQDLIKKKSRFGEAEAGL